MLTVSPLTYTCRCTSYKYINNRAHVHTVMKLMYTHIIAVVQPLLYELLIGCNIHITTWHTNHVDWMRLGY